MSVNSKKRSDIVRVSDLKHKVNFLTPEDSGFNDFEDSLEKWKYHCRKFVCLQPLINFGLGNLENVSFGQVITESIYLVSLRYDGYINSRMRMEFENRWFDIKRIINLGERKCFMQLIVREIMREE